MSRIPDNRRSMIVVEISSVEDARQQAARIKLLLDVTRDAEVLMACSGFDDDPRELDQIPEACAILRAFGEELTMRYICRFDMGPDLQRRIGFALTEWLEQ